MNRSSAIRVRGPGRGRRRPSTLAGILGLIGTCCVGCAAERDPRDLLVPSGVGVPVVDAILLVGQPLPPLYLTRTVEPGATFDASNAIVPGAAVSVENVANGKTVSYRYSESGRYLPQANPDFTIVRPGTEYRLIVRLPSGEEVRATTRTPPDFRVDDWVILEDDGETVRTTLRSFDDVENPDNLYHEPDNQIEYSEGLLQARMARPEVPAFQVGLSSLDLGSEFVIDPDFFDEEDFEELDRVSSSPPLIAENGTLRMPWFAIYFAGRYVVKVFAMDRNWYDAARSIPELNQGGPGFGGNAGDNFERPIFHVEGGIGLFGSAAVDSIGFVIHPKL